MALFVSTPPVVGASDEVHTAALNALLATAKDAAGNEYIYLKGVGSLVAYDAVTYDELGITTLLAANAIGPVAIAQAAVDATTKWGWFMIRGTSTVNMVANSADNAGLGKETTNGKLGDNRAAGDQIANMVARSATTGAATGTAQFTYPYVDDFIGA